jgi:hypothetical protein
MKTNKKKVLAIVYFALFVFPFSSCNMKIKFDKEKWDEHPDLAFSPPYRNKMLTDLTAHHKLIGLHYSELIEMLGKPNFSDSNFIGYTILVDYGSDIDPVYTKNLNFNFSKDSIITSYKIDEWKK